MILFLCPLIHCQVLAHYLMVINPLFIDSYENCQNNSNNSAALELFILVFFLCSQFHFSGFVCIIFGKGQLVLISVAEWMGPCFYLLILIV